MAVTAEQVATLRAQLAGDLDEHKRLLSQLDRQTDRAGYGALVAAGFYEAVTQRFTPDSSAGDVIEFVADVRARSERAAEDLEPRAAERMILAAYTDEQVDDIDRRTKGRIQIVLLSALVGDQHLDDAELDAFMARVRDRANEWMG